MIGESGVFRPLSRWKGVHISHAKAIDSIAGDGNTLSKEGGRGIPNSIRDQWKASELSYDADAPALKSFHLISRS